jgi:iron complex outermembrane receptor protein
MGLLSAKIQQGAIAGGAIPVNGHKLPEAPNVSATLAADWTAVSVTAGQLVLHLDGNYASRQYFELENENRIAQDPYGLLNARLAWHGQDDRWELGVWGNNVTNHFYLTNAYDLQALGFDYLHRGLPREYGLDVSYHFH